MADSDMVADPAGPLSYNTLRKKYSGWNASNFEDAIKKVTRPSELDELRVAIKYFLSKEDAIKLSESVSARLNQLSDRLISFGDFLMAYKNAELAFKEMRDRCVKRGNDWVCASYMSQIDFFIHSQATDRSRGGRRPLNDMLGKVREGYELVKLLEEKWTEFQDKEQIPGFIEEEIHDIFKGLLAREIGQDRFWASMDIRSEVEGRPIITLAKKKELIDLWAKHGILLPAEKRIVKPEITIPKPPAAPMEPIPLEEVRRVIKREEDLDKRIEELRKKKELERQREKERQEGKPPVTVTRPPVPTPPPAPAVPSPELDLMKDEIEKRIAEIMRKKRAGEGMAGEPAARYAVKKKDLILHVTGTESKYSGSGSQWIKTPVSVSIEKDQNAHYLLYRRGSGKEISTSYHTKTYAPIYIERYQGPFGYTVEIRFTDERNSVIKAIFDPAPNPKFINGVVLENEHRIAEFDVDEASFRKAEQFARVNKVLKEATGGYKVREKFPESPEGIGDDTPPQEDIKSWAIWAEIVDYIKKHGLKKWMDFEYVAHLEGMTAEELKLLRKIIEGTDDLTVSERLRIQEKIEQRLKPPMRDKDISKMSYAELHFLISTEQDTDELKRLYSLVDTLSNMTDFDKELLKEEIVQRMQRILEAEESAKPGGPNEGFAEGAAGYDKKDKTIEGAADINPKLLHRKEIAHLSKDIEDKCIPLGYINIYSLYPKSRFGTDTAILYDCRNTDSSKLKRDTIAKGETDIIIATSSKLYLKRFHPNLTEIIFSESGRGGGSVAESTLSYDITNIEDVKKIKVAALCGVKKIWIVNKGREGLILSPKYGKEWWEKASEEDIERITVYERSAGYSHRSDELSIVETNLLNVGYDLRNDGRGHMVLPNGKGVSPTNHRGIVNHWEVIVDAGYLPSSNIFKLKHSPDMIIAGAINKGWRRWTGEASYEIRDLSKTNADFINMRLKQHFDNGLHDAHIDVWSEGKYYNFDKSVWDKSNHDILHVIKKIIPKSYHPAKAMDLKLMENEYLIRDPASIGDPDAWIVSKGAAFLDDIRGAHHGQVDGTLMAYNIKTRETIGYIDYSLFEGKLYLNSIEVESAHRRQGYATALVLKLKKLNPGMPVKWGMMTETGCALKCDVEKESPDNPQGVKVLFKGVLGEEHEKYRLSRSSLDKMWGVAESKSDSGLLVTRNMTCYKCGEMLQRKLEASQKTITCPSCQVQIEIKKAEELDKDMAARLERDLREGLIRERREYTKVERIAMAKAIAVTTGERMERGMVITLDDIARLSREEKLKAINVLLGPAEKKKEEVIQVHKKWTFDDFKNIINRTTNIEDLAELSKQISESEATTPRERIELHKIAEQREVEIRSTVREDADADAENLFKDEKKDCKGWTFGDYEILLPGMENHDELEEMLDCLTLSNKLTDSEIKILRKLIEKKMEE